MKVNIITKFLIIISIPLIVVIGRVYHISTLVTFIYIPFLFILSLFSKKNSYFIKFTPIRIYFLFFLLSLASVYNAIDTEIFLSEVKTQIGCIIFGIAIFNYILINPAYIKYFFFSCILTTYVFALYLFVTGSLNLNVGEDLNYRINDETFNANVFPYYIFLSSFSFFFLFHLLKSNAIKYLYFLSIPLYLYIIFSSGSRGGLIIFLLIQTLYWFYIGTGRVQSFFKSTVKLVAAFLISLPALTYAAMLIMEETNIGKRFDVLAEEGESTIRVILLKLAFEKFQEYPFLGLGSGNFRLHNQYLLYSHNNFMEILVNNGIVSFIAYLMIFITTSQNVLAIKKKTNNPDYKKSANIILLFILGFCLYSFFYVFMNVIPFTGFIFSLFAMIYIMNYNIENEVVK